MRSKPWLAVALVMTLPVMFITASCSKKVARTQAESTAGAQARKAPDSPAEAARPDARGEEERLRAEAAAREAAAREAAAREAAAREAAERAFANEHIPFAFDSSSLSDEARQILTGKARYLRTNPDMAVTVEGHCDDRGTDAYNTALGDRRADSVKAFLVDLGIGADRLDTVSNGEQRPVAVGHDEASWTKNRRAQFVIR